MPTPKSTQRILLCLDFDLTLTQTHLFRYVVDMINGGFSREDALLRAIKLIDQQGPRGGEQLWETLAIWLTQGHGLVVTSYTSFPELPIALLSRGVALLRKHGAREYTRWLSRPLIVFGDPAPHLNPVVSVPTTILISQDDQAHGGDGKNTHISTALKYFQDQGQHFDQALLIDDDPRNIELAKEAGYLTILAVSEIEDVEHLTHLQAYVSHR